MLRRTCWRAKAVEERHRPGVLMNSLIRDSANIAHGSQVKALGTHPLQSVKRGVGGRGVVRFPEGASPCRAYLYAG